MTCICLILLFYLENFCSFSSRPMYCECSNAVENSASSLANCSPIPRSSNKFNRMSYKFFKKKQIKLSMLTTEGAFFFVQKKAEKLIRFLLHLVLHSQPCRLYRSILRHELKIRRSENLPL